MSIAGWSRENIDQHLRTGRLLDSIKNKAFAFVRAHPAVTEWDVNRFILDEFKKQNLETHDATVIVAFGSNTSFVHYFPKPKSSKRLKPDTLILIDVWARLKESKAPYSDITWMGYYRGERKNEGGRVKTNPEIQGVFGTVVRARNAALAFMRRELHKKRIPAGSEVDAAARDVISKAGYGKFFLHSTGHPLGFTSPHGRGTKISPRGRSLLTLGIAYTIEPGIYLKEKLGVRSEMDFYITRKLKLVITTPVQRQIVLL